MSIGDRLLRKQYDNFKDYEENKNKVLRPSHEDDIAHENKDDYIYYNFEVSNPAEEKNQLLLEFDVNRIDAILKNPSEYEIGIENFSISSTLPIFVQSLATAPDFKTNFGLLIEIYDPNTDQIFGSQVVPTPITENVPPLNEQYKNAIPDGLYDYQQLVNAINLSFLNLVLIFNANHSAGLTFPIDSLGEQTTPFMRYFQETGTFRLYAPQTDEPVNPALPWLYFEQSPYFPTNNNGGIPEPRQPLQIRFSRTLGKLFSGFSQYNLNDGAAPVVIGLQDLIYEQGGVNDKNITTIRGVDYLYTTTQYDCRPNMNQFNTLVFETDSVPIKDELLGTRRDIMSKRLFDYTLPPKLADRSRIVYNPNYVRFSNLQSNIELRQFTMRVFFESPQGDALYFALQPNEEFKCKVIFRRKNKLNVSVVN